LIFFLADLTQEINIALLDRSSPPPKPLRPFPGAVLGNTRMRRRRIRHRLITPLLVDHLEVTGEHRSIAVEDHLGAAPPSSPFLATTETLGEPDLILAVISGSDGSVLIFLSELVHPHGCLVNSTVSFSSQSEPTTCQTRQILSLLFWK
jgi:hypothetical protein